MIDKLLPYIAVFWSGVSFGVILGWITLHGFKGIKFTLVVERPSEG